jgi:hypothetical protein
VKVPSPFTTWAAWRRFHRTVWVTTLRQRWSAIAVLVIYTVQVAVPSQPYPLRLICWVCGIILAMVLGSALTRNYVALQRVISHQIAWRQVQNEIRAKMLADGLSEEEADTALWQMDLELERKMRGHSEPE